MVDVDVMLNMTILGQHQPLFEMDERVKLI